MRITISKDFRTLFKVYNNDNSKLRSSMFDLITGDKETKQTKGLAYLLKINPTIINKVLNLPEVSQSINELKQFNPRDLSQTNLVYIDAEMLGKGINPIRRDITISFYKNTILIFVLIIEAKSIKAKKVGDIAEQLNNYMNPAIFKKDANVPKMGITITKYNQSFEGTDFISLTWSQLINVLIETYKENDETLENKLISDYINFLMEVDKEVDFYEKQVLSIPAGKTFELISEFYIHACPNSYPYKKPLYITFRKKGGEMDTLYEIDDIFVFNPSDDDYKTILDNSELKEKDRINDYIVKRKKEWRFKNKDENYRFYILSKKREIKLSHKPQITNSGHCYFSLAELLSCKKNVVVESKE